MSALRGGFGSLTLLLVSYNDRSNVVFLLFESPPDGVKIMQSAGGVSSETHGSSPSLSFNSLTLDELSEELDRRTEETQRLQNEVENATKLALERFGCTYDIRNSSGQSCHKHIFNIHERDPTILSTDQQAMTETFVCDPECLNRALAQADVISPGEKMLENAIDDCLQHLSGLQLNETHDQSQQEASFSFDKAIVTLQAKLHKVQMEKDFLSDLRLKDSRKHVSQMEKMLCMLEELQNIKRAGDQKLQQTEDEALALNRKVETLEQNVKEMYSSLISHEKQCGLKTITGQNDAISSRHLCPTAKITEEFNSETDKLQDMLKPKENLRSEERSGVNKQTERVQDLIASLGQEMALLTNKLSSSKNNSVSLSFKFELLKKLAEKQTSLHQSQVTDLKSTLSNHKDKVCCLEQQLIQAQSQLVDARREKEHRLQQAEQLQSELSQLKRCGKQQQCELQEEVKALRGQLEAIREQLCRDGEDKTYLQALLEQVTQEGRKSHELLGEKNKELEVRKQETWQLLAKLEEVQRQCQVLHSEGETLRLKLDDREKMIDILRLQMESSIQTTVQHSRTIDNLHQENALVSNQLNQHKLEIQQLRVGLDRYKSDLAAAEHERRQLQASLAEQSQRVQEESQEKQQLTVQLEVQRMQLLSLTKEHKELQNLHSCKTEEHKGAVLKLQSQLRNTHEELDKVRSTLRTLEGADGHGLQVAMDMQRKITARREQIDSLQSKIKHLEEKVEKLDQEKRYQSLKHQRQLQELTVVREEKRHLGHELEALRSKDKQLRDRISRLEAILHKMSESFAECQDFIQLQEQDFFRLKLRHALDLKELRGQNLHPALNVPPNPPSDLDSSSPSALVVPPSSQHASNTQITSKRQLESSIQELRSLVRELRGVISENHRPHTDNSAPGSSFHRRRSAPERVHRTTLSTEAAEQVKVGSRLRRKTCGSEPHFLKTPELNGKIINKSFSESRIIWSPAAAAEHTSSPQLVSLGRRSPVHSLLTSDPNGRNMTQQT